MKSVVAVVSFAAALLLASACGDGGEPASGKFAFAAAGDHGANSNTDASLTSLAGDDSIGFYIAAGDLSYSQITPESAWCSYVQGFVGSSFPFQLETGNHEDDGLDGLIRNFTPCLPDRLGSTGDYGVEYYFDYPSVSPTARFIEIAAALTVDGVGYDYNSGSHRTWLEQRIQEGKAQGLWVVVTLHKVCITMGSKSCEIGEATMDLLIAEGVDMVLQGHEHNYQRSHSLSCADVGTFLPACVADDGADGVYARGAGTVFVIDGRFGRTRSDINLGDSGAGYFVSWLDGAISEPAGGAGTFGYVKYVVTSSSIMATFVPTTGGVYTDAFTIE